MESYSGRKDCANRGNSNGIMNGDCRDRESDPYSWEAASRLTFVGRAGEEADFGMYFEEKEGRKRKWQTQESGKRTQKVEGVEEKEPRKAPPKKVYAAAGDMAAGSATSSSSSHMSPGWQVNDLDLDLPGELSMNEALLSLPSLAVFKQEAPSPTGGVLSPRRAWAQRRDDRQPNNAMAVDNTDRDPIEDAMCQQAASHNGNIMTQHAASPESMQCQPLSQTTMVPMSGYHTSPINENKATGLLLSPATSLDGFLHSSLQSSRPAEPSFKDDTRFQYVLAAATSIATKQHEETLTYLNQGQPYEIKLKKLGDLSHYKGKILKSTIKICFHERRLQYMEREQIARWHSERPGERLVEVDVPLSYGVTRVQQPPPPAANAVHVLWDPTKDVGVYIKVNCISTEFTAKKHGGEKGVPFRVQVETYLANVDEPRLHAAACQIKVFKLKGADRKHKQDREKVMRRPRADLEKYQPSCEATVLTTLSNDALLPPPSLITSSPRYSPELCASPKSGSNSIVASKPQTGLLSPTGQMKPLYCQDGSDMKVSTTPPCHSPGAILPDLPQPAEDPDKSSGLSQAASAQDTQAWLRAHRFAQHANTFANFAGADLLRLSRDDIIQICGLADGIRLYNALHARCIEPRLTLYVCPARSAVYSAVYLHDCRAAELLHKLKALCQGGPGAEECARVLVAGPRGARVRLTDELVRHLPDHATFTVRADADGQALLLAEA